MADKQIAIYTIAGREGLAIRFRQQLNENSKVLSWHNVIPEMTHNEIVGWRKSNDNVAVVFVTIPTISRKILSAYKCLKRW